MRIAKGRIFSRLPENSALNKIPVDESKDQLQSWHGLPIHEITTRSMATHSSTDLW
jgi:hypothetical protein